MFIRAIITAEKPVRSSTNLPLSQEVLIPVDAISYLKILIKGTYEVGLKREYKDALPFIPASITCVMNQEIEVL